VGNAVMRGLEVNNSDMRNSKSVHSLSLSLSPFLFCCCLRKSPRLSSAEAYQKNRKRGSKCTSSCQRHLMRKLYSIIRENITACVKFTSPAGAQKPGGESDETCLMPPTGPVYKGCAVLSF